MQKSHRGGTTTTPLNMGKLAVLMPGLGAVATTFIAGVELMRRKKATPAGSVTQLGSMKGPDGRDRRISEVVPLASLEDLVFGTWDLSNQDGYAAATRCGVLSARHLSEARELLERISPRAGVHEAKAVRELRTQGQPNHVIAASTHREKVAAVREDIVRFLDELGATRAVMIFCASAEGPRAGSPSHESLRAFEKGLDASDPAITPTMLYAYAALQERVPFINGTPNLAVETPALQELSREKIVPIAGKDLKSGQALMNTVVGPMLKMQMFGEGAPDQGVPPAIEQTAPRVEATAPVPESGPAPKQGWDDLQLSGWLGYPMQIQTRFVCHQPILAAPLVLDLALFADLAMRRDRSGVQEWLSFYFQSPVLKPGHAQEHDLFVQRQLLERELRAMNEELRRRPAAVASTGR